MRIPNAKQDALFILSWFRGTFSSPSFKIFSSLIVGFIQLGKEGHTSAMSNPYLALSFPGPSPASPGSSERIPGLGMRSWLRLSINSSIPSKFKLAPSSFFSWTTRLSRKRGRKSLAAPGIRTMPKTWQCFRPQGVLTALFYKHSVLSLLGARLYHPKGAEGCGRFHTKISLAKKILQSLRLPVACKLDQRQL
jgi:hypothetical protein